MRLSEHFLLAEFTVTQVRGVSNEPPPALIPALQDTAGRMEAVRTLLGFPIIVTSGYRSPEVNKRVGGSKTSAHMGGRACDFICPLFGTPNEVARKIAESNVNWDQLIAEGGAWIHIAFAHQMRRDVLTAHFGKGGTTYEVGIARA